MLALYFAHYNFCRSHKTLHDATPAMAANLTGTIWSLRDLLEILGMYLHRTIRLGKATMNDESPHTQALAEALTALIKFVPKTRLELDEWYNQAKCVLEDPALLQGSPHFIWHYLADADIRMKDESYAEMQNLRIKMVLQHLNQGEMPSDEDTYLTD